MTNDKKNVIFSYLNILKREIEKKKYLSFLRKIFNLIFKIFINSIKKKLNIIVNLDKQDNSKIYNYSLEKLFTHFNCDKGKLLSQNDNIIKTHNYTPYYADGTASEAIPSRVIKSFPAPYVPAPALAPFTRYRYLSLSESQS